MQPLTRLKLKPVCGSLLGLGQSVWCENYQWHKRWKNRVDFIFSPSLPLSEQTKDGSGWVIFSSRGVTGVRIGSSMTKRLILTESLRLKEEVFVCVSLPGSCNSKRRGTRCSFVPEHMVLRLHPHGTCASDTAPRLSPLAPGLGNRYSTAWSLRRVWVWVCACEWVCVCARVRVGCLCMWVCLCGRERKWKTGIVLVVFLSIFAVRFSTLESNMRRETSGETSCVEELIGMITFICGCCFSSQWFMYLFQWHAAFYSHKTWCM